MLSVYFTGNAFEPGPQLYWGLFPRPLQRKHHFTRLFASPLEVCVKTLCFRGVSARGIKGYQGVSRGISCLFIWDYGVSARRPVFCAHMKNHVSRGIRSGEVRAFKILKGHRGFANWKEGGRSGRGWGPQDSRILPRLAPVLLGFGASCLLSCSGLPCSSTSQPSPY